MLSSVGQSQRHESNRVRGEILVPAFKQKILEAAQNLRASKSSDTTSRAAPPAGAGTDTSAELEQAEKRIEHQQWQIKQLTRELRELQEKVSQGVYGSEYRGIDAENVVWIFGTARTGSTWLAFMMEELEQNTMWREPYVGVLFGQLYNGWVGEKHFKTKHFILGQRARQSWVKSVRAFVLNEASMRFPAVIGGGYLVIKEPNGSAGAPLMMEALPESRMIFLVRDPRDVVASALDAARKGSWLYKRRVEEGGGRTEPFEMEEDALAERTANLYVENVGNSKKAYDAHRGPKVFVKYEDLRSDTLVIMRRIYSELGMEVDDGEFVRAVEKHAWENIPAENKGEGKFHRKATPGGWHEDLTGEQVKIVERITAPLLKEFYP